MTVQRRVSQRGGTRPALSPCKAGSHGGCPEGPPVAWPGPSGRSQEVSSQALEEEQVTKPAMPLRGGGRPGGRPRQPWVTRGSSLGSVLGPAGRLLTPASPPRWAPGMRVKPLTTTPVLCARVRVARGCACPELGTPGSVRAVCSKPRVNMGLWSQADPPLLVLPREAPGDAGVGRASLAPVPGGHGGRRCLLLRKLATRLLGTTGVC